jgi:hypothetical protein
MTHVVNSLQFQITCPDEEMAFNLRHNFGQTVQQDIAQIIDEVCSETVGEDESIKIDRIELDMGSFSRHGFGTNFKAVFTQKLRNELAKKLSDINPVVRQASRRLSDTETLLYFLSNGTLPWFADEASVNIDEIFKEAAANQPGVLSSFFQQKRSAEKIWQRISWQLDDASKALAVSLSPQLNAARETIINWINQIAEKINSAGQQASDLAGSGSQISAQAENDLVSAGLQRALLNINNAVLKNAVAIFTSNASDAVLKKLFTTHIATFFSGNEALENKLLLEFSILTGSEQAPAEVKTAQIQAPADNPLQQKMPGYSIEDAAEKYSVKHAGLVLLAPFLKPFFTELNLLEGNDWKTQESAFKAVHLLKFLADGRTSAPEYTLVFEKILCGLPVEMPVPLDIVLEDNETAEAASLLQAILTHWKILQSTNIDGLRESFIKRDGILTKKETGWQLQVERKTLDVLLDRIPWGYSTISLGWNRYLIFVEW